VLRQRKTGSKVNKTDVTEPAKKASKAGSEENKTEVTEPVKKAKKAGNEENKTEVTEPAKETRKAGSEENKTENKTAADCRAMQKETEGEDMIDDSRVSVEALGTGLLSYFVLN